MAAITTAEQSRGIRPCAFFQFMENAEGKMQMWDHPHEAGGAGTLPWAGVTDQEQHRTTATAQLMAANTEIICLYIWALNLYLQIDEPAGSLGSESHFYVTV